MDQIIQHTNSTKKYYHDQMSKMIVILGMNKCDINYDSYTKLTHQQNQLLMSIVDTPKNDLCNGEGK